MSPPLFLVAVVAAAAGLATPSLAAHGTSFKNAISGIKSAHDHAAAAARLKHIQAAADTAQPTTPSIKALAANDAKTSFQIYTSSTVPKDAPAACQTALTAAISCNSTVLNFDGVEYSTDELDAVCVDACTQSLNGYRAKVVTACAKYTVTNPSDGSQYPPTLAVDAVLASYNVACERDASGSYCGPILSSYGSVPAGGQGVLAWPKANLCTPCTLGALNLTVSNPFSYNIGSWNALQSALKTCGSSFSSYNVTHPPGSSQPAPGPSSPPLGSNSTTSAVCALTGRNVTLKSTTKCVDLAKQYKITAFDVMQNNPTFSIANCTNGISSGATVCLPAECTLYSPDGTQTCDDIVKAVNKGELAGKGQTITSVQLVRWNPNLQYPCPAHTVLDKSLTICVTPHGGFPAVDADPDSNGGNPVATPTATVAPPGPTSPGTTAQCGQWAFAANGTNCQQLLLNSGVTFDDFRVYNPEIDADCTNLWANYWYCIIPYPPLNGWAAGPTITASQASITMYSMSTFPAVPTETSAPYVVPGPAYDTPPSNIAPGTITAGCSYYYNVTSDDVTPSDACKTLATGWGMDPVLFTFYNNDTALPCPKLKADTSVCLMVLNMTAAAEGMGPSNRMAGSGPYGCTGWYTIVSGDDCGKVIKKFGLSSDDFFGLNPELSTDCTNLVLDAAYCVSPPPAAAIPTTTSPPSGPSSTTSGSTPTQTVAPGSWTNCTTYYQVQSGESCQTIETKYKISQSDFLLWNPEIKSDCSNLDIQRYCVAGSPAACGKTYTVVSGDFCSAVETKNKIDDATLHKLNPWLDANCDMQVGQILCVAPPTTTSPPPSKPTNIAPGSWTNCSSYYQVVSGDSCNKIEAKYSLSLTDLLKWNSGLDVACDNLVLDSYCVDATPKACGKIYTVASGDFCSAVETKNKIDDATLRKLNPWLDTNCDMQVGQNLCVATPTTTSAPTSTTTKPATTSSTKTTTTTSPPSKPTNIAAGSWTNCTTYYQVVSGDSCNKIQSKYSLSLTDLLHWNSGLHAACDNLLLDSYCVAASPKICTKVYTVASGDFCSAVETKNNVDDATLRKLNPWLDTNCDMQVGQNLCVAGSGTTTTPPPSKPTNIAPGSWSNCTTYYQVVSGDSCNKIESKYSLSLTDLLQWNSGLHAACDNLLLDSYCVAAKPKKCGKTYTVASGDFCSSIETKSKIDDATLRKLNPWLNKNCDLQVGQLLCVAAA